MNHNVLGTDETRQKRGEKLNKQKGRLQVKESKCELAIITYIHEKVMIAPC